VRPLPTSKTPRGSRPLGSFPTPRGVIMEFTNAQKKSLDQIDRCGLHINKGQPCECGEDAIYGTKAIPKYSDSMVYQHCCKTCGNKFETWTEG